MGLGPGNGEFIGLQVLLLVLLQSTWLPRKLPDLYVDEQPSSSAGGALTVYLAT
jgi:hypothetical protein